jgi:cell wall-associated NlpC family hydrolase
MRCTFLRAVSTRALLIAVAAALSAATLVAVVSVRGASAGAAVTAGDRILAAARSQLGKPYCFAGGDAYGPTHGTGGSGCKSKSIKGFDCSGLALYAYAQAGIRLTYHYTDNEYHDILAMGGKRVSQAQAAPGSLIFFHTNGDKPAYFHHVAIYSGNGMLIEAAGYKIPLRERPIYPDDKVVFAQPPQLNYWHGDDWFAHHGDGQRLLSNTLASRVVIRYDTGWWGTVPLTGDWDGNGTDTAAFWDRSTGDFYASNSQGGSSWVARFGKALDIPIVGDWTGVGRDSFGVYRPSTGQWFVQIGGKFNLVATWGRPNTYQPIVGDWDGNGTTTIGLRRMSTGNIAVSNRLTGGTAARWTEGRASDIAVIGDWNGDRKDTLGFYRPSSHTFFLWNRMTGSRFTAVKFGSGAEYPLVGDWNGDGKTTLGVVRPTD